MTKLNHLHKRNISSKRKSKSFSLSKLSSITILALLISFLGIIVVIQAFRWQVLYAEKFRNLSKNQYSTSEKEIAQRGKIEAIDGTTLAIDLPVWNIYATLSMDKQERELFFSNKEKFVAEVSGILNLELEEVNSKLTDDFVYAPLAKGVSTEKKKALQEANIFGAGKEGFGLYFEREEQRTYPNGSLASHVLGFLGKDSNGEQIGQYGIQGYYFRDITGKAGYSYEEKDSSGNVILTSEYEPVLPRSGKDFKLTIVPNIQTKVERILEDGVKHARAKSGSAIIMNPKTGAIIAMANYPTYNPSEYWRVSESWILKNRAVSDVYEYGSVHKPITVSIGIETGAIDKNFQCNDSTGYLDLFKVTGYADLKGQKVYTWNRKPAGLMDIADIFKNSNNPCTAQVALKVNSLEYYSYLKDFGIGEFIGIGLQDEATSYMKPFDYWTRLDIITSSYGQSISATPLQVISALSTFANNGERMRPYIISEISDEKETIKIEPKVLSTPISKESANDIKDALVLAVQRNSLGGLAKGLKEYNIAAKTGTAQVLDTEKGGYKSKGTNDTVVGFAPAEDPKMIMLVKLEEPQIANFATLTTVPIWKDIFLEIADNLEISKKN
ncbi:MAG: peptidoglycan D,D-transpeptidase FtsI family protein [Candidatus Dojkabacteria bacterium]|jgi:cell division protein FtsI/penicillin-binding protein 2